MHHSFPGFDIKSPGFLCQERKSSQICPFKGKRRPRSLTVVYAISDQEYLLSSEQATHSIPALGSPEWFATIERLAPFRFYGHLGHMSVHAERRQSGKAYWSAYRKYHHKQYHLYVGMTDQLSPARLEQVAARLQTQIIALGEGVPEL